MAALRLGLIGHGAIGRHLAAAIASGAIENVELVAALVRRPRPHDPIVTADPDAFFAQRLDAVVEGAGHDAVRAYAARALRSGADLLVTSVGAFADDSLYAETVAAARASGRRLILPSAGIGALDILAGAAVGGLDAVQVVVRKDPLSWKGTAAERVVHLDSLTDPFLLFDGPVREGARLYPQNVNISAAVALAGIGLDRTRVRIYADPTVTAHVVEVEASGAFGRFRFVEEVAVSAENPKTGRIVAMALVKAVRQLASTVVIGA